MKNITRMKKNDLIIKRALSSDAVFLGQKVIVRTEEGYFLAEVAEISKSIKNLITKVKVYLSDGKISIIEASDLIIDSFVIIKNISKPSFWQYIKTGVKNLFTFKKRK